MWHTIPFCYGRIPQQNLDLIFRTSCPSSGFFLKIFSKWPRRVAPTRGKTFLTLKPGISRKSANIVFLIKDLARCLNLVVTCSGGIWEPAEKDPGAGKDDI